MNRLLGAWALLLLGGCASTAPEAPRVRAFAAPPAPSWLGESASPAQIRAVSRIDLPDHDPPRLARDLADAQACQDVRTVLARTMRARLQALDPACPSASLERFRNALERASFPGCRIVRRSCVPGGGGRQWCWAAAVLDSDETLPVLERELGRIDSLRAKSRARELLRLP